MIKLIASDLDGTIVYNHEITKEDLEMLSLNYVLNHKEAFM